MTITGYSNAIVSAMLGWLKGFANWVLRLFNLAGSASTSPLLWLANNWLKLLIVLMVIGITADILVWLVRWRPHWVWFRKERVIVNDESFLSEAKLEDELDWDDDLEKNWQERDYVVASTVVKRAPEARSKEAEKANKASAEPATRRKAKPEEEKPSTIVKRRSGERREEPVDNGGRRAKASFQRGERREKPGMAGNKAKARRSREAEERGRKLRAEREDLFGLDGSRPGVTDFYEDEVFNVSNLPSANDYPFEDQ